jgi:hypothetical protein
LVGGGALAEDFVLESIAPSGDTERCAADPRPGVLVEYPFLSGAGGERAVSMAGTAGLEELLELLFMRCRKPMRFLGAEAASAPEANLETEGNTEEVMATYHGAKPISTTR